MTPAAIIVYIDLLDIESDEHMSIIVLSGIIVTDRLPPTFGPRFNIQICRQRIRIYEIDRTTPHDNSIKAFDIMVLL